MKPVLRLLPCFTSVLQTGLFTGCIQKHQHTAFIPESAVHECLKRVKESEALVGIVKAGKVIQVFLAKDGREVVLRTPRWEDLDDLLELINSLVEERADIVRDQKVSRGEEIEWSAGMLTRLERGDKTYVVAEVGGRVVANSDVGRGSSSYDKHTGVIGIAIKKDFRDIGIGTEMMRTLVEQGKAMGLKVLTLGVFANNARAIHVYEKVRFVQTGRIPKKFFKEDKYVDEIIMTKVLE